MTSANTPEPGFVTFGVLRTDSPEAARRLVGLITGEVDRWVRHTDGFHSARTHVSLDGATVVQSGRWADEKRYRDSFLRHPEGRVLHTLGGRPEVRAASGFSGFPAAGVRGPAAGRAPGLVGFAVRRLTGPESARAVLGLLARSGEWKRTSPGFISASPYIGPDGTTFVNCPMWVDRDAYDSYMKHPDIAEGLEEVARLEVAPPEFLLCTVAADIGAPARDR
ncbi:hypothetical protein ACIQ1J_34495 [Streptomyces sp. NPDC097107]|uniref:hypothetical protein n=1 Tax=Streptomyces sp. NPDC097107 TaxID=3366089 RepID=UPI00382D3A76